MIAYSTKVRVTIKNLMHVGAYMICLSWAFMACNRVTPQAPPHTLLDSALVIPTSTLSVPIYYPVQELEDMANEKLGDKIIEAKMPIKKGGDDSLFLSISKFQQIKLEYNGVRGIEYKVPVQIDGFFKSKVLGIKINNKEAVRAKVIITMYSDLYLDDQWNLMTKTQLKEIKWVEDPKLNVAGIKVNLKPTIEKALLNNEDKITKNWMSLLEIF